MQTSVRAVDVFICAQNATLKEVGECVESIRAHLDCAGGRVVIVGSFGGDGTLQSTGCDFLTPSQICGFEPTALPGDAESRDRLFAEIIKWELRRFSNTPTYLVIDANCVLSAPTALWDCNQPVLFCENRFRFGYLMCFNWFFGQYPYPTAPACSRLMHMDRSIVDEMVGKIQGRYKSHWAQAVVAILQQVSGTAFDAGQNYGHYLGIFRPGTFVVQEMPMFADQRNPNAPRILEDEREDEKNSIQDVSTSGLVPRLRVFAVPSVRENKPTAGRSQSASSEYFKTGIEGGKRSQDCAGVVRMGTLGYNGRFANQVFQYAFLKLYAQREVLRAECPPWIGCSLFGHHTSMGENELPIYRENKGEVDPMIRFDPDQHYRDIEIWGYFQNPRHWADDRQAFRELFQPLPFLKNPLDAAIARLRSGGKTLVAIHLRRGDFVGGSTFWPAPEAWYLRWLHKVWPTLVNPVLYVATDDPENVLAQFADFEPKSAADLHVTVNGAEFYSDFYLLSQCDRLGISNSTFSFAAAMMNTTATEFARPDPVKEELIAFDPWTSEVQLRKPQTAAAIAA